MGHLLEIGLQFMETQGFSMNFYFICAAAFSLVICVVSNRVGRFLGVIDSPDGLRKRHSIDTPLVGGLAAVVPFLFVAGYVSNSSGFAPLYMTITGVTFGSLILGYIDDRGHISPVWRLTLSVALAIFALIMQPALRVEFFVFSFFTTPIFLQNWSLIFTVLALVGLQNAVNMADGQNGLVIGLSLVWVLCIAGYAPAHLMPLLIVLLIGLSIALPFNLKGHLFLGDSGSYGLSMVIGLLSIYVYAVSFTSLSADVVALWFLVPIADCLRLMVMRVLAGRSPFHSDRSHFHHILGSLMPFKGALTVYLLLVAVPAALAFWVPNKALLWALITLSSYIIIVFFGLRQQRHGPLRAP